MMPFQVKRLDVSKQRITSVDLGGFPEVQRFNGGGDSRHGLIDGFHTVAHGELIHYLLGGLLKVHLPGIVTFGVGDLHHSVVLDVCHIVEQVLQRQRTV